MRPSSAPPGVHLVPGLADVLASSAPPSTLAAWGAGLQAGVEGRPRSEVPFAPASSLGAAWGRGWAQGHHLDGPPPQSGHLIRSDGTTVALSWG